MPDFSSYLESVGRHYEPWCRLYTPIDAVGQADRMEWFDFGFMVQTIVPQKDDPRETGDRAETIERFMVLEGLRKYAGGQVLLVGRPGSGKSTALTQLLLEEVLTPSPSPKFGRGEQEEEIGRVPVLVELRYWNEDGVMGLIRSFLVKFGMSAAEVDRTTLEGLLRSKKLLLLMDGLNELPSEAGRQDVRRFRREFSGVAIVFTTRELGGESWGIEKQLEMQPLTPVQMKAFVMAYLPEQGEAMIRQLGERLREFGSTPLLLWMLCRVFAKEGRIPENLGEVFRVFTRGYERQVKQDVVGESDRRLWGELLKQLASRMMTGEKPTELRVAIGDGEIYEVFSSYLNTSDPLVPRQALDDLLRHHLIQRNGKLVEFRHQLIQEYYAAEWLLERVGRLDDETLKGEFLNYLKWTESVALMLALVEDEGLAVRVVEQALEVDLMLGARLAGEVRSGFQGRMIELVNVWEVPSYSKSKLYPSKRSFTFFPPGYVHPAIDLSEEEALVNIDDLETSISSLLKLVVNPRSDRDDIWRAATVLGKINSDITIPALLDFLEDSNSDLRWRAISALGTIGADTAIPSLRKLLVDSDSFIRSETVDALGKIGSDIVIEDLLKLLVNSDSEKDMRLTVLEALGKISSSIVIPDLLKIMEDEDSDIVCCAAHACLGIVRRSENTIAPYLPNFLKLVPTKGETAYRVIRAIQSKCEFYNYEIQQTKLRKADRASLGGGGGDSHSEKIRDRLVVQNFYGPVYGIAGNVEGDQIVSPPPDLLN